MNTATITSRTLDIDGMTGDVCVQKVTGALKGVQGVKTESVKVGSATIGADQAGCTAACAAIDHAGFKSHEHGAQSAQAAPAKHATQNPAKPYADQKTGDHSCSASKNAGCEQEASATSDKGCATKATSTPPHANATNSGHAKPEMNVSNGIKSSDASDKAADHKNQNTPPTHAATKI